MNAEKGLTEARTDWMSGRLGNGQILEWKPFLVGFRLEFDGVAGRDYHKGKKIPTTRMYSRWDSISACFLITHLFPYPVSDCPYSSISQQVHWIHPRNSDK